MGNLEQNRRRNQIVAERSATKARASNDWKRWSDELLWQHVELVLDRSVRTEQYSGHVDRAVDAVVARECARELKLRGIQLQLPV